MSTAPIHIHHKQTNAVSWAVDIIVNDASSLQPANDAPLHCVRVSTAATDEISVGADCALQHAASSPSDAGIHINTDAAASRLEVSASVDAFRELQVVVPTMTHATVAAAGNTPLHVDVKGKLEGDTSVSLSNASLTIGKVRGETVILQVDGQLEPGINASSVLEANVLAVSSNASVAAAKLLYQSAAVECNASIKVGAAYGSSGSLNSSRGSILVEVLQGAVDAQALDGACEIQSMTGGGFVACRNDASINWRQHGSALTVVSTHGAVKVGVEAAVTAFVLAAELDCSDMRGMLPCSHADVIAAMDVNRARQGENLNPASAMLAAVTGSPTVDTFPALRAELEQVPNLKAWKGSIVPGHAGDGAASAGESGKVSTTAPADGWWASSATQQQQQQPVVVLLALRGGVTLKSYAWGPTTHDSEQRRAAVNDRRPDLRRLERDMNDLSSSIGPSGYTWP